MNSLVGPWDSHDFETQVCEALVELLSNTAPDHPLIQKYIDLICADLHIVRHECSDAEVLERMRVLPCFRGKVCKVAALIVSIR